jgi:hypothetical protein
VRGRALDERDTAASSQRVAVINALLAQQLFQTEDVVGRRFRLGLRRTSPLYENRAASRPTARYTAIREDMPATAYLAASAAAAGPVTFEVRVANATAFTATARDVVRRLDDQLPTRRRADDGGPDGAVARAGSASSRSWRIMLGLVTLALVRDRALRSALRTAWRSESRRSDCAWRSAPNAHPCAG